MAVRKRPSQSGLSTRKDRSHPPEMRNEFVSHENAHEALAGKRNVTKQIMIQRH